METRTVRFSGGPKDGVIETIQTLPVVIEVYRFIKTNPWAPDSDSRKVIEKEVGIYRLNLNESLYYWQGWQ